MSAPLRVGIYCRISEDPRQKEAGVKRQEADGRKLCALRDGWEVADVYVDNDISALKGDYRPEYERLLADVRAGKIQHIVVYMSARLWRNRRERAQAIELFARQRVSITATQGGEIDLTSAAGRAFAGLIGEFDTMESEIKSERVARAALDRAEQGRANAHVAYGWRRERVRDVNGSVAAWWDVEDPVQAGIVREIVDRLLAGDGLKTIAADLNERGIAPPRAALVGLGTPQTDAERAAAVAKAAMDEEDPDAAESTMKWRPAVWRASTVRKIAMREANIGKRVRGVYEYTPEGKRRRVRFEILGDAAWPAIVDEEKHAEVVALLNDPARVTSKSSTRKHLLSYGIGECGVCGDRLRVRKYAHRNRTNKAGKTYPISERTLYICDSVKGCTGRSQADVDRYVGLVIVEFLSREDTADLLVADDEGAKEARAEAATARAKLAQLQDDMDEDLITREMYVRGTKRWRAKLTEAEEKMRRSSSGLHDVRLALDVAGPEAERKWAELDVVHKRALLEALDVRVTLLPTKRGPGFNPHSVRVQVGGVDRVGASS